MAFLSFSTFLEDEPCRARVRLGAGRFLSVVHFLSMLALGVFVLQDLLGPSLCWEVAWFADLLLSSCGHCPGICVPYLAEAHVSSRSMLLIIRSSQHCHLQPTCVTELEKNSVSITECTTGFVSA